MKSAYIHMALLFIAFSCKAQPDSLKWIREINGQVWKPFITSFVSGDQAAFRAVHSSRITRVQIDDNVILDHDKYFPGAPAANKNKNTNRLFELRFDKRICNGSRAWESGYYKGTVLVEGKPSRSYYGRFYVVLDKESDGWKIIVDADTGKGANEESFQKAFPME